MLTHKIITHNVLFIGALAGIAANITFVSLALFPENPLYGIPYFCLMFALCFAGDSRHA